MSSSPATGSSCEVGSSSRMRRGRRTSAAASATRCSSPPERVSVGRSSRWSTASARVTSSIARARDASGSPRSSRGSSSSPRTVAETTWVSGSWPTRPTRPPSSAGPCSRTSRPHTWSDPGRLAAVVVGDEAAAGAQQARLARAGAPREDDELARLDLELERAQRRRGRVRVGVREGAHADDRRGLSHGFAPGGRSRSRRRGRGRAAAARRRARASRGRRRSRSPDRRRTRRSRRAGPRARAR